LRIAKVKQDDLQTESTAPLNAIQDMIKNKEASDILNTPTIGKDPEQSGFQIRPMAEQYKILCFTALDTAKAYFNSYENTSSRRKAYLYHNR
ncbi:MAG: hypothetical protein MZV70_70175, partial [Desulfobacterales bacterium]|nr:hypothetical protein [Desulfobacterales bacterium]